MLRLNDLVKGVFLCYSYFEIYNEKVADLLTSDEKHGEGRHLKVREHPKKGPYVEGISCFPFKKIIHS